MPLRAVRGLWCLLLFGAMLGGCAPTDEPLPDPAASSPGPLDWYYVGSPERYELTARAKDAFLTECMRKKGFAYVDRSYQVNDADGTGADHGGLLDEYWGVSTVESAQTYGYHAVPMDTVLSVVTPTAGPPPDGYNEAMDGPIDLQMSDQAGSGGCWGEFQAALNQGLPPEAEITAIHDAVWLRLDEEPRALPVVTQASQQWSECMSKQGYSYADPHSAFLAFSSTAKSNRSAAADEIAVAVVDATCKAEVGFWEAVRQATRQVEQDIADHMRPDLEKAVAADFGQAANAAAILQSLGK
ncbi:MAG: hypothetical protein LBG70_01500 [Bifidobacteriaceae bacterium]|nr:hypothetical protein [Bifidobacteriaceae bacterium]